MELIKLQKLGGLALIAGGILLAGYTVLFNTLLPVEIMQSDFSRMVLSPYWAWVCAIALLAIILLVFGFTAAYSKLYASSGVLGLIGYITLTTAYIFQAGQLISEVFFYPAMASTAGGIELFRQCILINHPMARFFGILFLAFIGSGVLLFGITLIRSKVHSTLSGILFMTGAVLYAVSPLFLLSLAGILIFATGCFLIGLQVQSI